MHHSLIIGGLLVGTSAAARPLRRRHVESNLHRGPRRRSHRQLLAVVGDRSLGGVGRPRRPVRRGHCHRLTMGSAARRAAASRPPGRILGGPWRATACFTGKAASGDRGGGNTGASVATLARHSVRTAGFRELRRLVRTAVRRVRRLGSHPSQSETPGFLRLLGRPMPAQVRRLRRRGSHPVAGGRPGILRPFRPKVRRVGENCEPGFSPCR